MVALTKNTVGFTTTPRFPPTIPSNDTKMKEIVSPRLRAGTACDNRVTMESSNPWLPAPAPEPPQRYASAAPPPSAEPSELAAPFEQRKPSWIKRTLGPALAAIAAFAAKLKTIALLLPKLKLLTTSGTMLVSIAAYATFWGFQFAVGFVVLLLVHEMGHVIQLRREGIKASAPMFIPFMGAVITSTPSR